MAGIISSTVVLVIVFCPFSVLGIPRSSNGCLVVDEPFLQQGVGLWASRVFKV